MIDLYTWASRFRLRKQLGAWVLALFALLPLAPVHGATLVYEAFVAGAFAGQATVNVALIENRYEVTGNATAEGVAELFSAWHTQFRAHGQMLDGAPQPAEYSYVERDDDQTREIMVRDGILKYFKNGRKRREGRSPEGLDVLAALFVQPRCEARRSVHTGRKHYRLTRLDASREGVCRYDVVDDDDDHYQADFVFAERGELTVPVRITVRGILTGKLVLVDH